jgi:hypothetical protein
MAKETYAAVLRLVKPEINKEFAVSFTLPNSNKPTTFTWDKKGNYEVEVPTKITYVDDHKQKKVFSENYAKSLLASYGVGTKAKMPFLEFVREFKRDEYVQPDFPVKTVESVEEKPLESPVESVTESSKETKPKGNKNEK